MAYEINKTNGASLVTIEDNNIETIAGITLVGRSRSNYGEYLNENLIRLTENFANSAGPTDPIVGQLWWDTSNDLLNIRTDSGWAPIGNAIVTPTEPGAPSAGTFWFDSSSGVQQLKMYDGTNWQVIGPELVGIGGASGLFSENVEGNNVLAIRVNSILVAIISATEFAQTTVADFPPTIVPGINFRTNGPVAEILTKTISIEETAILPVTDNTTNLGSAGLKWADVYATTFNGALSGNATTASSTPTATNATNSANIAITANSDDLAQPLVFVSTTTGNLGARVNSDITYNPAATEQILAVPNISATTLTATGAIAGETIESTVADGTAPFTVTSTTVVANLQAATAAKWHTGRTVTFASGDVTGNFTIDGSANVGDVVLTIAANSVALGNDTSGNYVNNVTGTNGIAISGTAGEGWAPGVGLNTTVGGQIFSLSVGNAAVSTTQGEIRATNDITAFYSSDIALKENILPIDNALEKLQQISGVYFDWKDEYIRDRGGEDGYFVRKRDVGVIAQDVQKILPEVVGQRNDGILAVKYDRLVSLLIESVKELSNEVSQLKQKLYRDN